MCLLMGPSIRDGYIGLLSGLPKLINVNSNLIEVNLTLTDPTPMLLVISMLIHDNQTLVHRNAKLIDAYMDANRTVSEKTN